MKTENYIKEIERLNKELEQQKVLNKNLRQELEVQDLALDQLSKQIALNKLLNGFNGYALGAAAADLLVDPNPVELTCSGEKADTSEIFHIRLLDILAIHSEGRMKRVFLRKKVFPTSGGSGRLLVIVDRNEDNFESLLFKLQKGGKHLLRVHRSYAINIYHYIYAEKSTFNLKDELRTKQNEFIHSIPVTSLFNEKEYQTRVFEINKLKEYIKGFQKDQIDFSKKLEELGLFED